MTTIRKLVIEEERISRLNKPRDTLWEGMLGELDTLIDEEPDLGWLVNHYSLCFRNTLKRGGAPEDLETLLLSLYLDTHLSLISMFRRELELRNLERTFGK